MMLNYKFIEKQIFYTSLTWSWTLRKLWVLDNIPQGGWREAQIHDPVIQFPLNLNLPSTNYLIFLQSIWTGPSQTSRRPRSSPAVTKLNPAAGHRAPPWPNSTQPDVGIHFKKLMATEHEMKWNEMKWNYKKIVTLEKNELQW